MNRPLWRPLDAECFRDPYQMYKALRENDPVHLAQTGEYIVTKYEDVRQILKSESFETGNRLIWLKRGISYFENKEEDLRAIYAAMNSFVLMLNGSHHQRIRNFISKAWSNREVDSLIEANSAMLLNRLKGHEIDFVKEYAQPLPVYTMSGILGIPVSDSQYLISLGVAMTKTLDLYISLRDMVQINDAAKEFINFFREQIRLKSDRPDEGLLSRMIHRNRSENVGLSEEEMISLAIFLLTAGEETSASLITNTMVNLLSHPDQLALLRKDPSLIESTIEEVLRYDSSVHLLGRVAKDDLSIRGKVIPSGSTVTLVVASANRDEDVFQNADVFDIARRPNRHLSFGNGKHYCLGDWLGRRQSQIAISSFLERFDEIVLPDQELSWYQNIAVRRLNTLRIITRPRA